MPNVDDEFDSNTSANPSIHDVVAAGLSRRSLLKVGAAAGSIGIFTGFAGTGRAGALGTVGSGVPMKGKPLLGFQSVPLTAVAIDGVVVPPGYTAEVLFAWGDPVSNGPAFAFDASQTWQDQEKQAGMHHDGIDFFALPQGSNQSHMGLLCMNHEYVDQGLLFTDGMLTWTPDKVRKALAAHGVSVIEVRRHNITARRRGWSVNRPSKYGRRITGVTPMDLVGPAAGSPLLQTADDPTGRRVLGTLNNCGSGRSLWGTFLTCEENFNGYFGWDGTYTATADQARYGISAAGFGYRWHEHDPRFNVRLNPNEPNRFGWVVEIDPYNPTSVPKKLTALGRFKHESAAVTQSRDGLPVVYSGDDERNNYIYKFVGKTPWRSVKRGKSPLEEGTLFVARFNAGPVTGDEMGVGEWIPLTPAHPALVGKSLDWVLVNTRLAADLVGATKMDRPEFITVAPDGQVYATLTNNSRRGRTTTSPSENPNSVVDEANPRSATGQGNPYGHIIRWRENGDAAATTFTWDIFVLAGDPANPAGLDGYMPGGDISGDRFGSPDGIYADRSGRIWIQTDISTSVLGTGAYANIPNNMMLAADPSTNEVRRFLVGPKACEVTGVCQTHDQRTMFVDIQHPGEPANEVSNPASPQAVSNWPDYRPIGLGRPRAATLVITKDDGGVIGT